MLLGFASDERASSTEKAHLVPTEHSSSALILSFSDGSLRTKTLNSATFFTKQTLISHFFAEKTACTVPLESFIQES